MVNALCRVRCGYFPGVFCTGSFSLNGNDVRRVFGPELCCVKYWFATLWFWVHDAGYFSIFS